MSSTEEVTPLAHARSYLAAPGSEDDCDGGLGHASGKQHQGYVYDTSKDTPEPLACEVKRPRGWGLGGGEKEGSEGGRHSQGKRREAREGNTPEF